MELQAVFKCPVNQIFTETASAVIRDVIRDLVQVKMLSDEKVGSVSSPLTWGWLERSYQ